jgi:hypothetical protein
LAFGVEAIFSTFPFSAIPGQQSNNQIASTGLATNSSKFKVAL